MTKFEQLLDYIVNEEHDKANELFHEIVVEKSREIYENLISEEEQDEEVDEAADEETDESVDEAADEEMDEAVDEDELDEAADEEMDEGEDEEADESMDLEDSYMMDGDDDMDAMGGDATDDLEGDVSADSPEEELKMSIQNAMAELQAAFDAAKDMSGDSMGGDDEFAAGADDDMGADDDETPEDMMGFMEGRRMTREYVEKVGNDWDKGSSQKQQAKHVGAGSGDTASAPNEGRSPISSGSGKPTTGAHAKNLVQHHAETAPDGTTPHGKAGGFLSGAKDMGTGNGNVPGGKMGVKNLKKVSGGHGAEKKGSGPGPVGSGTGDKAGQTSMGNQAQLIKHIK